MEKDKDKKTNPAAEEISLKDVFLKVSEWIRFLWKKKWTIILFGLIGAGLGLTASFILKPKYKAELIFVVEGSKGSLLSAYSGIASQLGIDLGGGGATNGAFDGDNVMGLLKSRRLVEEALLKGNVFYEGKTISLADFYMIFNKTKEGWKNHPELLKINYRINSNRLVFTREQDSVLNVFQKHITDHLLTVEKPDKKLNFISVSIVSPDETFSKVFVQTLVNVALDFYINTKTQRNKINVDRLQSQADSLEIALNQKVYSVAKVQDLNANPAKQIATVGLEVAQRDKVVLQTMYGEVIKNLELSKLAMAQETPVIQIIDTPILPLEKKKFGKLKGIVLGGILAGFLTILVLIIRRVFKQVMAS